MPRTILYRVQAMMPTRLVYYRCSLQRTNAPPLVVVRCRPQFGDESDPPLPSSQCARLCLVSANFIRRRRAYRHDLPLTRAARDAMS